NLGVLAENRGNLKTAEYYYLRSIEIDSLYYHSYNSLADFYTDEVQDSRQAMYYLNKAIEVQPYHATAYTNLADFHRMKGLLPADTYYADSLYFRAEELNPYHTWAWFGHAYLMSEKFDTDTRGDSIIEKAAQWNAHKAEYWNEKG